MCSSGLSCAEPCSHTEAVDMATGDQSVFGSTLGIFGLRRVSELASVAARRSERARDRVRRVVQR